MNYSNGDLIHVGDKIQLGDDCIGIVVCSMDDDKYNQSYTKEDWSYLNEGILIEADSLGLLHYTAESEKELIKVKEWYIYKS